MQVLAAADTLAGDAANANLVTLTVFGMELAGTTETYKVLYQGQLPSTAAALYTVPAATQAFIRSISVVNTDAANAQQFQLFRGGTAAANAITPLFTIPAGGMALYVDGNGWSFFNASGQQLNSLFATISDDSHYGYLMAGFKAETLPRHLCPEANNAGPASGTLFMHAIYIKAGTVVSNISLFSATTAAGTPTNYLFGLYDSNRSLLAQSANQLTAAWAANSLKTLAMTVPYTVPVSGLYYIGFFMTATTMPTLKGGAVKTAGQLSNTNIALHGTSTTGLTTALPNPAAALTVGTTPIWAAVS